MTHQAPLADAPPQWTLERMDLFIRTLTRTRCVASAARAAGMSRQAVYKLRARLRGHPFDRAWEAAMAPQSRFRQLTAAHAGAERNGLRPVTGGDRG